jgi:predicted enzyme related to lactoylglutathione lyase
LRDTLSENGSQWLASFAVENFDQSLYKAQRLGATLKTAATDVPHVGRYAVLEDPQGALFSLISAPQENHWALRAAA